MGSLARYDQDRQSARYPTDPSYQPVAQVGQPSPFTRVGPSLNGAIKPDLVDYGGNRAVDTRGRMTGEIGELSTSREFATGRPFAQDAGTSFAAPHVAHAAARILSELPDATPDLCRALLVAHASPTPACRELYGSDVTQLRHVTGYGLVDRTALYRSLEGCVTLWATGTIQDGKHHFYELPIPEEFWTGGRRDRHLTVALAYKPPVRTTRIDYRAVGVTFSVVKARSLREAALAFNAATDRKTHPSIPEPSNNREVTAQLRSRGTVQASTWTFKQPSQSARGNAWFVVVTRNDPSWGEPIAAQQEPYALAVRLDDRLAAQPRLYSRLAARLRARTRARATA